MLQLLLPLLLTLTGLLLALLLTRKRRGRCCSFRTFHCVQLHRVATATIELLLLRLLLLLVMLLH